MFRPRPWLRWSVVAAVVFWMAIFFLLVGIRGSPNQAFASAGFFIALFTALGIFYANIRIEVTNDGLVVRGFGSFRLVPFSDVVRVDVKPGLMQTSYAVLARGGFVNFTSLFSGHQRLMSLIVERSRLARLGR